MANTKNTELLNTGYEAKNFENEIYKKWEDSGYFNPDKMIADGITDASADHFSIIMPPPNANGSLHAGHALFVTVQDILIRYNRMQGKRTLWLPGADHAGFETQTVYEKILEKEGRSRFELTRGELYKEILDFTLKNKSFMEGQVRQLGASCDWSREMFTLDPKIVKIVYDTFEKMYNNGYVYRGNRIVNWCPKHQTSLSNLETNHQTRKDPFYYFKYGPFTIATARPETKFGDKYVVMHPEDSRYSDYTHGQQIEVEWINGKITATVIKDEVIDMKFGTGVMTITPWHDVTDFELAKKHNLDMEQIIDERGKLLPIADEFAGMNIKDAREKIVEKLREKGLLVKVEENYEHSVSVCFKCEREIEPQVKAQWFVKMRDLADKAMDAVSSKKVNILTDKDEKIFNEWMKNIQDWNISRQIAWGIPIPAKICMNCDHGIFDNSDLEVNCEKCGTLMQKDSDTFDTWFSSGQWPYATLMSTGENDMKNYYPTSVMETAADIIFFWVARMIMFSLYKTEMVPFNTVYLHGLVLDAKGKKMSKSKGNVINPVDLISEYGCDATRMGLIVGNSVGTNMNLDPKKIGAYKKFANKIWNASRFVLDKVSDLESRVELIDQDKDILNSWKEVLKDITLDIDNFRLHLASEKIYGYFWHTFCDEIIETLKIRIQNNDSKESAQTLLITLLEEQLKVLHPFMPFITETIWSEVIGNEKLLMVESWPKVN